MLQFKWKFKRISSEQDVVWLVNCWHQNKPEDACAFDTETTGLHIILDKPFLFQFGWVHEETKTGYAFCVETSNRIYKDLMDTWHGLCADVPHYLAHNVKFDLHMLTNIGAPYNGDNVDDTQFYIRLGTDAVHTSEGGAPLALKDFAAQYIESNAKYHETLLRKQRSAIAQNYNVMLLNRLKAIGDHRWTLPELRHRFIKDIAARDNYLTEKEKQAWQEWKQDDLPNYLQDTYKIIEAEDIRYDKLDRETVITYAYYDIVYVLEIYYLLKPIVMIRDNLKAVELEREIIYPLYEMERVGFRIDKDYMYEAERNVREYMLQLREQFKIMAGKDITVSQHKEIKHIIESRIGYEIAGARKEILQQLKNKLVRSKEHQDVVDFIDTIDELRTLEKWYSTYILRFIKNLRYTDRLYTTIQQVGTVSGRVTSDFQQFPKKGIQTRDGRHLFSPRRAVITSEGFDGIVYLDYSQIELRFQALYTILVGHPDMNLCRAYMPYECYTKSAANKIRFDCTDSWCIRNAYNLKWYRVEDDTLWTPTDVHGATTQAAFDITPDDPNFHDLRYVGKRVNFAKNYGAQYGKICEMFPEYDAERCHKIDDAYYKAFPGVKAYHEYCYNLAKLQPYATNLFGVHYYGVSGHKLINMLVQGSAAYFLKWKISQIYKYTKENNIKSRFQMNIHDELSWEKAPDEDKVFTEFQNIMQDWDDGLVPLIADMEITHSTWEEKVEVKEIVNA